MTQPPVPPPPAGYPPPPPQYPPQYPPPQYPPQQPPQYPPQYPPPPPGQYPPGYGAAAPKRKLGAPLILGIVAGLIGLLGLVGFLGSRGGDNGGTVLTGGQGPEIVDPEPSPLPDVEPPVTQSAPPQSEPTQAPEEPEQPEQPTQPQQPSGDGVALGNGISVPLPPDWEVLNGPSDGSVTIGTKGAITFVASGTTGDGATADDVLTSYVQGSLAKGMEALQVSDIEPVQLDSGSVTSASKIFFGGTIASQQGSTKVEGVVFAFTRQDGTALLLDFTAGEGSLEGFSSTFVQILNGTLGTF